MSREIERLEQLKAALRDAGFDGMLVSHPNNRRYLTGFTAEDIAPNESAGFLLVPVDGQARLVTSSVNVTQARAQAPHVEVQLASRHWGESIAPLIMVLGLHRLAYEPMAILEGAFSSIVEALQDDGYRVEWSPSESFVEQLRLIKDDHEIALLRKAFEITCAAMNEVAPNIQAGQTEREVAWALHSAMVERGAEGLSFPIIVATGANAARPHHEPGNTRIEPGQPIVIDMGAMYEGYCADLTRTYWVGEPDDKLKEIYPIVADAVEVVLERAQPGLDGQELDSYARDFIDGRGYGEAFSHSLGHGVGLRVHEGPSASRVSEDIMAIGNAVTVEPGIYLEEWGGVRVEDVVLFTENGCEILTEAALKPTVD